ncbi:MAG: hypothetical protein O7H41_16080 [Planctomycetota bacterium]|nr:hypothetical protein [Planctomycetota bacterium]
MTSEADYISIVVVGDMNPAIHNPHWYREVGIIDTEEEEAALKDKDFVVSWMTSQLRLGKLRINCQRQRYQISCEDRSLASKLRSTALKTFDDLLFETPISHIGFNFNFHRRTGCADVSNEFARMVLSFPIGIEIDNPSGASVSWYKNAGGRRLIVRAEPSVRNRQWVYIAANAEYGIEGKSGFKLKPLFDEHFEKDLEQAEHRCLRVVTTLNAHAKGPE